MTDDTPQPGRSEDDDARRETDDGAREQGVRTEHPDDLSSPQMTSPVDEDESAPK